jgi:hypothetical protein
MDDTKLQRCCTDKTRHVHVRTRIDKLRYNLLVPLYGCPMQRCEAGAA